MFERIATKEAEKKKQKRKKQINKRNKGKRKRKVKEPVTEETSDDNDEGNYIVDWHAGFDKPSTIYLSTVTGNPDEVDVCQVCKIHFDNHSEDRQAEWIGCSGCWRWSHYDCAGFTELC